MALLFMDGFDADDTTLKWDVGTSGSGSATTRFGSGRSVVTTFINKNLTASSEITTGFATRTGQTAPQIGFNVSFYGDAGGTQHITVMRNTTTGLIQVRRGSTSGTLLATGTKVLQQQIWNYIEIRVVISDSVGVVEVRVDGAATPDISFSGDTKNAGTATTIDRATYYSDSAFSMYYDDLYILDSTGTTNTTFLGDVRVQALVPNGNGNYSQLTGSDGNSTDNYLLVDELPYVTADYVGSFNAGDKDSYTLSDLVSGTATVFGVQNNIIASKDDAYVAQARPFLRLGGTDYNGTTQTFNTSYQTYYNMYNQNPATSTNWTVSDVNTAESGFEVL
jgi:hypothetical protein